ncbi:MAG TPA: flagellar protein FlbB [Pseudolabrys sp.]|jgi:flagellar motility protein MotE (MotC chaperone)|nr:flagellar protein FlbB [Pseudolabrys sp.]
MNLFKREFRLIPLVLVATISLFALKVSGLVFDGGYTLGERLAGADKSDLTPTTADTIPGTTPIIFANRDALPPEPAKQSWAREMFNYGGDITGSVGATKPAEPPKDSKDAKKADEKDGKDAKEAKVPAAPPKSPNGLKVNLEPVAPRGERAILERLSDRRQQLDARDEELAMRENLLKAAEKRVEAKVAELKALEAKVKSALDQRDETEAKRFKGIVAMYEGMKPKDAARIFDRLDLKILVDVSTQMKPATMSAILAQMAPESAERLTVELAQRASAQKTTAADALPQIEGRPAAQ